MNRPFLGLALFFIVSGAFLSSAWEANLGTGYVDYSFFPWGLLSLTLGAWLAYYSYAIKSGTSPNQFEDPTATYIRQKKTNRNLKISVFAVIAFLVMFTVVMNIPFIPSSNPGCSEDKPVDLSIMGYYFPCNVFCNVNPLTTDISFYASNLTAGVSATNSSRATAALSFEMNNPCSMTPLFIISATLSGYNISVINRWDSRAGPTLVSNVVPFSSNLSGSANELIPGKITHFVFYPTSETLQTIVKGEFYSFYVKVGVPNSTVGFGSGITAT